MEIKLGKYRHFKGNEYEVVAVAKTAEMGYNISKFSKREDLHDG